MLFWYTREEQAEIERHLLLLSGARDRPETFACAVKRVFMRVLEWVFISVALLVYAMSLLALFLAPVYGGIAVYIGAIPLLMFTAFAYSRDWR